MDQLRLQYTRPDGEADTYHLKPVRRYHVGRGSSCEVRILDMKMSRQHFALEADTDTNQWLVIDLGSTNGVSLDGNRVNEQARLQPGGVITAGNSDLVVSAIGSATADIDIDLPATSDAQHVSDEALEAPDEALEQANAEDDIEIGNSGVVEEFETDGVSQPVASPNNDWEPEPSSALIEGEALTAEAGAKHPVVRTPLPADMPAPGTEALTAATPPPSLPSAPSPTDIPLAENDHDLFAHDPQADAELAAAAEAADNALDDEHFSLTPAEPIAVLGQPVASPPPSPVDNDPEPQSLPAAPAPLNSDTGTHSRRRRETSSHVKPVTVQPLNASPTPPAAAEASAPTPPAAPPAPKPAAPTPAAASAPGLHMTLLGRRVGPLTREQARELKARELKGELTEADLEGIGDS